MFWIALTAACPALAAVEFNRDIRPILSSKCFACHGPDSNKRKAGLRLDLRDDALKTLASGKRAIVPGNPAQSELLRRITCDDDDDVMPPPKTSPRLDPKAIAALTRWVADGAPYAVHWAYAKPVRPALPAVKLRHWPVDEIDHFVLAELERQNLAPSAAADRHAILRRVCLDLTGLPPMPQQAEEFARDNRPDAYEHQVDRLLASSAFGERWASLWLDLARYADSQGFAPDQDRVIWRYRDWVIQALNANLTFDQFTIQQIAGDLLPGNSPDQLIATAFHRNTLTNTEGGTNDEEFRVAAVVDRVNTTMQVWMGSTFACAQCHNHKYDPFSQKEYYQLFAIFNQTQDADKSDESPVLEVARAGQEKAFGELQPKLQPLQKKLEEENKKLDAAQPQWEKMLERELLSKDLLDVLDTPTAQRTAPQKEKLARYFRAQASPAWRKLDAEVRKLTSEYKSVSTTVPVMREGEKRDTHILLRGDWTAPGDKVEPGLPSAFPTPSAGTPMNRLTLARWLVSPDNPLTARVAVNRLWEELFGIGIVETSEDFGMQGEPPSHPQLLDWLATEYIRLGWDTKKLLKTIVMSATYRQSSAASPQLAARDPFNRLLARGPRVRLSAEAVRDQALFAAGLLSDKMFGPPCQPLKPNLGLNAAFGPTTDWKPDTSSDRWRRGLYIRIRRNAPYPSLTTFDAPERTTCTVRRIRTNTPLQSLVTLNDPCFIEAAQGLARRILREGGESFQSRLAYAFEVVLARPPHEAELRRLADLFEKTQVAYAADREKATSIATEPLGPAPARADVVEMATWTVVSNVLLNLDETLSKR